MSINAKNENTADIKNQDKYADRVRAITSQMSLNKGGKPKVCIVTFGCQQNEADSEKIMGSAQELGYEKTASQDDADLIIFNTCAVREHAELKALSKTGQLKHLKDKNPDLLVGLWGCMVNQESRIEDIKHKYPYVDFVAGTNMLHRLPEILCDVMVNKRRRYYVDSQDVSVVEGVPTQRSSSIKALVSIMYGCDNFCTYCIVPYVRGRERSRKPDDIISEVKELVAGGCKEITLLGQNVNSYGKGLDGEDRCTFPELLERIANLDGDFVLRFMTSHPKDASDELVRVIRDNPKIERHFHLPLQSGDDRVLKAMNRKYTAQKYLEIAEKLKSIPDMLLTTDIIVGFPSETDEEFENTLKLAEKVNFDAVFSFIYSPRPGTPAAKLEDPTPYEQKTKRMSELLGLQRENVLKINQSFVGKTVRVLCETKQNEKGLFTGRTSSFKLVKFESEDKNIYGKFVNVKITGFSESCISGNAVFE